MPWWPKRGDQAGSDESVAGQADGGLRVELPAPRSPERSESSIESVDMARLAAALDRLEIRYLTDGDVRESVHFAAGLAICEAAGCVVTDLRGRAGRDGAAGLIAAADAETHTRLLALVRKSSQAASGRRS